MMISFILRCICFLLVCLNMAQAQSKTTNRGTEFANSTVHVWKTTIYPSSKQVLKMHRHDHDRVVIALSNGLLKITNNKGKIHYLKLEKEKAYYLPKDIKNELHNDENISKHPIKVMVVEFMD